MSAHSAVPADDRAPARDGDQTVAAVDDPIADLGPAPGRRALGPAVARFDDAVDRLLEHARGTPALDRIFTTASHVAEFSLVWHVISLSRGVVRNEPRRVAVLAVGIGLESLVVNQGLKRLFGRTRPTAAGDARLPVRQPLTSSFPSGHASAAAFASTVMSDRDGPILSTAWYGLGTVVAVSRAYVRIHHASDVVGGLVVGRLMGLAARRVVRRFA